MAHASFRGVSICALALGMFTLLTPIGDKALAASQDKNILTELPPSPAFSSVSRARLNVFLDALEDGRTKTFEKLLPNFDDPLLQKASEWMWLISPNSGRSFEENHKFH